jgi:hypothetical protein
MAGINKQEVGSMQLAEKLDWKGLIQIFTFLPFFPLLLSFSELPSTPNPHLILKQNVFWVQELSIGKVEVPVGRGLKSVQKLGSQEESELGWKVEFEGVHYRGHDLH